MGIVHLTEEECFWTLGALTILDLQRQTDDDPHRELTDYVSQNMGDMGRFVAAVTRQNRVRDFDIDIAARLAVNFAHNMGDMDDRVLSYLFVRVPEATESAVPVLKKKFTQMRNNGIAIVADEHYFVTLGDTMSEDTYAQKQTIADGKLITAQIAKKMGVKI